MRGIASLGIRLLALVGKEIVEIMRRPGAVVSLVFGPFLIMAIFGLGYSGERRPLETVIVIPGDRWPPWSSFMPRLRSPGSSSAM